MNAPHVPVVVCTITLKREPTAEEWKAFQHAWKLALVTHLGVHDGQVVLHEDSTCAVLGRDELNLAFPVPEDKDDTKRWPDTFVKLVDLQEQTPGRSEDAADAEAMQEHLQSDPASTDEWRPCTSVRAPCTLGADENGMCKDCGLELALHKGI